MNRDLNAWRSGEDLAEADFPAGSVGWMFRQVERHPKFTKTSEHTQRGYLMGFRSIEEIILPKSGRRLGGAPVDNILQANVDHIYEALQWVQEEDEDGQVIRRRRLATANAAIRAARRAWSMGVRAGWASSNPFLKPELEQIGGETRVSTREEVDRFIAKAEEMGRPSMALAAMLAFELCQRESDVIGTIGWNRYKQGEEIQVRQHKTGKWIWVPLFDGEGELIPGLVARLEATPRRGQLIVMRDSADRQTKQFEPYKEDFFRHLFREIADAAGLPKDMTFMSLRHSGLTELGDAEATDQELMSMSGHTTRQTLTKYVKPTRNQARNAARKRRAMRTKSSHDSE